MSDSAPGPSNDKKFTFYGATALLRSFNGGTGNFVCNVIPRQNLLNTCLGAPAGTLGESGLPAEAATRLSSKYAVRSAWCEDRQASVLTRYDAEAPGSN